MFTCSYCKSFCSEGSHFEILITAYIKNKVNSYGKSDMVKYLLVIMCCCKGFAPLHHAERALISDTNPISWQKSPNTYKNLNCVIRSFSGLLYLKGHNTHFQTERLFQVIATQLPYDLAALCSKM